MADQINPARATAVIVLLACALRLAFAASTGLGIDESYMVAASNHFAASYFDHPLASWWLELASRRLFGSEAPLIVRLPFVALSALSSWLLFLLTRRLFNGRAAFWAVAAYSVSPEFSLAFGCWVLPDGPLDTALLAAAYFLCRALGLRAETPEPRWWLAAGGFAGLSLLSKYNAALPLAGAALFVLADPATRRELRSWQPWAAIAITLTLFCPVVVWNAAHNWVSFGYQGGRAAGVRLHPLAPLRIWGGEALFVLPWLWLPMILLGLRALWRGSREQRLLASLAAPPILIFALIGLWSSPILYHWAAPGYLFLFPLAGVWLAAGTSRWRGIVLRMSGVLLAAAALLIVLETHHGWPINPDIFPPGASPLLQALDWDTIRAEVPAGTAVAALRWYDAGKIGYALRGASPITVFGDAPHEFGVSMPPSRLIGRDVLIVAMPGDPGAITKTYAPYFKTLTPAPALIVAHHNQVLLVIPMLLGHDLLAPPP